jgi:peptidoglycan-associated lipoprotein
MKMIPYAKLIGLGLTLLVVATGCQGKRPVNMEDLKGQRAGSGSDSSMSPGLTNSGPIDATSIPITNPDIYTNWFHNAEIFKSDSVHFAYDSAVVKSDEKSKVAEVANHLKGDPTAAVEVQGNCDERGTEEYNRSLGERRALAVREELINLGIAAEKVVTISYGKDKPVNPDHNEAAWKENRRADFVLLTPPKATP